MCGNDLARRPTVMTWSRGVSCVLSEEATPTPSAVRGNLQPVAKQVKKEGGDRASTEHAKNTQSRPRRLFGGGMWS